MFELIKNPKMDILVYGQITFDEDAAHIYDILGIVCVPIDDMLFIMNAIDVLGYDWTTIEDAEHLETFYINEKPYTRDEARQFFMDRLKID